MTRLNLVENSILYKISEVILIVATNMSADFRHFSQTCHFAQQLCTPLQFTTKYICSCLKKYFTWVLPRPYLILQAIMSNITTIRELILHAEGGILIFTFNPLNIIILRQDHPAGAYLILTMLTPSVEVTLIRYCSFDQIIVFLFYAYYQVYFYYLREVVYTTKFVLLDSSFCF